MTACRRHQASQLPLKVAKTQLAATESSTAASRISGPLHMCRHPLQAVELQHRKTLPAMQRGPALLRRNAQTI